MACPVEDWRFMQISSMGGVNETEVIALAVVPYGTESAIVVTTVTPLANRPMRSRNCSLETAFMRCLLSLPGSM
jgi:hypothetical protein